MKLYKACGRGANFLEYYKAGEGRRESALYGIVQGGRWEITLSRILQGRREAEAHFIELYKAGGGGIHFI